MEYLMSKEEVKNYVTNLLVEFEVTQKKEISNKIIDTMNYYRNYFNQEELEKCRDLANKILKK